MQLSTRATPTAPALGSLTLGEFYDWLERHDWYCAYSDDYSVTRAGEADYVKLKAEAATSPEKQALHDAYTAHMFNGRPWGTVQPPKPERPND